MADDVVIRAEGLGQTFACNPTSKAHRKVDPTGWDRLWGTVHLNVINNDFIIVHLVRSPSTWIQVLRTSMPSPVPPRVR
jgi:hypothetical protein